jgi:hypothetical protein
MSSGARGSGRRGRTCHVIRDQSEDALFGSLCAFREGCEGRWARGRRICALEGERCGVCKERVEEATYLVAAGTAGEWGCQGRCVHRQWSHIITRTNPMFDSTL